MQYSKSVENFIPNHTYTLTTIPCCICKGTTEITVAADGLFKYNTGTSIETAFPELTTIQREALVTGICSDECWDKLFGEEDDEQDWLDEEEDEGEENDQEQ